MFILMITILAIFFAINMGGASFAASFAASYGGRVISQRKASLLFVVFVLLGSVLFGKNVSVTLGRDIIPTELIGAKALIIIFFTAGLSMYVANFMKIPQSTSLVTVAAIAGVGAHFGQIKMVAFSYLIPFWILLPILSYVLTYAIASKVYPPRKSNFWLYEKFINHQGKLKKFVIASACYCAFSVGSNNVPNVVGPLMSGSGVNIVTLLALFALIYGIGAFVFKEPLKTAGDRFVPLGLTTATIISFVSGTLMIVASVIGIPQSFVMLQLGAIFAISSLKNSHEMTFANPMTRKTLYTWTINPVITFFLSWGLSKVFY